MLYFVCSPRIQILVTGDPKWKPYFTTPAVQDSFFQPDMPQLEYHSAVGDDSLSQFFSHSYGPRRKWDFLIAYFEPHDLDTLNTNLENLVNRIDEETLLVALASSPFHGNVPLDDRTEPVMSNELWLYSKSKPLVDSSAELPSHLAGTRSVSHMNNTYRAIQEADLVPTLSLLLGLPIPFSNLGMIIPELFWKSDSSIYDRAAKINGAQIKRFLDTYRSTFGAGTLRSGWKDTQVLWEMADAGFWPMELFTHHAQEVCKMMWTDPDRLLMVSGLIVLGLGAASGFVMYTMSSEVTASTTWISSVAHSVVRWSKTGSLCGFIISIPAIIWLNAPWVSIIDYTLLGLALVSTLHVIVTDFPLRHLKALDCWSFPLPLTLHILYLASSTYSIWEDQHIPILIYLTLIPLAIEGIRAPQRFRTRILGHLLLFSILVALISLSTICREEQGPNCLVTFYTRSEIPAPPLFVIALVLPASTFVCWLIHQKLGMTQSESAQTYFPRAAAALTAQTIGWLAGWAHLTEQPNPTPVDLQTASYLYTYLGDLLWCSYVHELLQPRSLYLRHRFPRDVPDPMRQLRNLFGAPYLLFWVGILPITYSMVPLTGQLVLLVAAVALLSFLEVIYDLRRTRAIKKKTLLSQGHKPDTRISFHFSEVVPLALLSLQVFYGTGHQAILSASQLTMAFDFDTVLPKPTPSFVSGLNLLGPTFTFALAIPLVVLWRAPVHPDVASTVSNMRNAAFRASMAGSLYFTCLLVGCAFTCIVKIHDTAIGTVFAPRLILAAGSLIAVDLALIVGFGFRFSCYNISLDILGIASMIQPSKKEKRLVGTLNHIP